MKTMEQQKRDEDWSALSGQSVGGESLPSASGSAAGNQLIIAFVQGAQYWEYLRTGCTMCGDDRNMMERAATERLAAGTLGKSPNERGQP